MPRRARNWPSGQPTSRKKIDQPLSRFGPNAQLIVRGSISCGLPAAHRAPRLFVHMVCAGDPLPR